MATGNRFGPTALAACTMFAGAGAAFAQDPAAGETALDRALEAAVAAHPPSATADVATATVGNATLRLLDLSLDALVAAGGSNQKDDEIQRLQGGGHDPHQRGFTIQSVELSMTAAVDPYFTAEAQLVYFITVEGESAFEMEEMFATTTGLPSGLHLEVGQFFTEFGRLNPQHPHQWDFQDQPVIHTRLFGPDGIRGPGFRLGWLTPLPWVTELHLGVQNANGETMASFLASDARFAEAPVGGRQFVDGVVRSTADVLWLGRGNTSFDLGDSLTAFLGVSSLVGPNATGHKAHTTIWGADLKVKWRPADHVRGWPFVVVQAEAIARRYLAQGQDFDPDGVPASGDEFSVGRDTLRDQGGYAQALVGFAQGWVAGVRLERAISGGDSIDPATGLDATDRDPLRDRRTRISVSLAWHPTETSRIRLQYNFDQADHMDRRFRPGEPATGHSVWLGLEFRLGGKHAHGGEDDGTHAACAH